MSASQLRVWTVEPALIRSMATLVDVFLGTPEPTVRQVDNLHVLQALHTVAVDFQTSIL